MTDDPSRRGCVIVTIRADRDQLALLTPDGAVAVEITPLSSTRSRVVVRAPLTIRVERRKTSKPEATP
jgi:hypothetical protein